MAYLWGRATMSNTMNTTPAKKRKPVPTYYYAIGAGGLALLYFLYSRSKASAAATAAAATSAANTLPATATPVAPASSYGNANDLSALLPYLTNLQGASSVTPAATTGTTAPTPVYSAPTGESLIGSGYGNAVGSAINDAAGHTYQRIATSDQAAGIISAGGKAYYQPLPGVFLPYDYAAGTRLAPGTPQYYQVS